MIQIPPRCCHNGILILKQTGGGRRPCRKPTNTEKRESVTTQPTSDDEVETKSSSTRPVTPTDGVSTPHISSEPQPSVNNLNNNQLHKKVKKSLKDAGVMCPSPAKLDKENTIPKATKVQDKTVQRKPVENSKPHKGVYDKAY